MDKRVPLTELTAVRPSVVGTGEGHRGQIERLEGSAVAAALRTGLSADQLSAEQTYFNDIYLLAPVGYFVLGFDTTILQMNVVGADVLGVPRSNPARLPFRQFVAARFHDDFDAMVRNALNTNQAQQCGVQICRHPDEQGFAATLRASADASSQAIRVVLELAEGKLAALERSEERFRRIVHTAEEGIWEIDAKARTSFVNPKMASMLGYAIEDMLGQPLVAFMDEEGRGILEQNIARRQRGVAERHEFKFLRKDGSELWTSLVTNPIYDADGAYLGALALVTDVTADRANSELIWQKANYDALTALPNRHMFHDRLNYEVRKAQREGLQLALLFIDLDDFKQVNDTLGHEQGDCVLIEAARRISNCVRTSDTVARLGGDEFTVILSGLEQTTGIERIAQNMLGQLTRPFLLETGVPSISASIGIALYPSDGHAPEELLRNADQAMYAAKSGGSNRYSYFTAELQQAAQQRLQTTLDLRGALVAQQFELHYQPIVNLATGKIERAEALLRWRHPERGLLAPAEFLSQAETGGIMLELGDWVFRHAARQTQQWQQAYGSEFQISVNFSAAQLRGDPALYSGWCDYVQQLKLSPHSIVIEIKESVLADGVTRVVERLRCLREMGLQVALDNFGNGHASLSHLKQFGIDQLKLDRSFLADIVNDSGELAMCEALVVMAHKLGLRVVAEGVETAAQCSLLRLTGCDFVQGYVYAGALAPAQFEQLCAAGLPELDHF
ncbi:putative bifunctional diguanylate cyclase/phosphodiesterase [Pseudoduganella danionis]|uniref:EAL domain-containing protein n=1 Tax=Pseudoduganella danionis TaxID=1890295 RepID=A0ABW9SP15_9BURK|nr:EAL domain-containing protein [Pseudoduganella danionis]MTW33908.1 EAL domain-containing protein [Pseudoduganella danionis]